MMENFHFHFTFFDSMWNSSTLNIVIFVNFTFCPKTSKFSKIALTLIIAIKNQSHPGHSKMP